jgi:hypothetical protein
MGAFSPIMGISVYIYRSRSKTTRLYQRFTVDITNLLDNMISRKSLFERYKTMNQTEEEQVLYSRSPSEQEGE